MLVPAATLQRELEHRFGMFQYSDELMLYNGCIQNYPWQFKEQDGPYQYAIVTSGLHLVGYISYNVDFYSHQVYGFGLICFDARHHYSITKPFCCLLCVPLKKSCFLELFFVFADLSVHFLHGFSAKRLNALGGTRTRMVSRQILSLLRLPFRHPGAIFYKCSIARAKVKSIPLKKLILNPEILNFN